MRTRQTRSDAGLEHAIQAAGSVTALADGLGLTVQTVSQWLRVPPERALDVERLTGVSRHVLRPDIYGPEPRRPLRRRTKPEVRPAA